MVDLRTTKYYWEMSEHANGVAQYLEALLDGRFVTRQQTHNMDIYLFAGTKWIFKRSPIATQEQKDAEIHRRKLLRKTPKPFAGL